MLCRGGAGLCLHAKGSELQDAAGCRCKLPRFFGCLGLVTHDESSPSTGRRGPARHVRPGALAERLGFRLSRPTGAMYRPPLTWLAPARRAAWGNATTPDELRGPSIRVQLSNEQVPRLDRRHRRHLLDPQWPNHRQPRSRWWRAHPAGGRSDAPGAIRRWPTTGMFVIEGRDTRHRRRAPQSRE